MLRQSEIFFLYKIIMVYRQKRSEILEVRQWGRKRRMVAESSWLNEAGVPAAEEAPSYPVPS